MIVPSPRGVVFREVGESATLEVRGLYSDGAERALPDRPGSAVVFSSSDPGVADVDAQGRITSLAPGGVDIFVEYGGVRAEVPVIVYGPYVYVPPYDPQRVVEVAPGVEVVVNRLILHPAGAEYDSSLAHQIAADYGGRITAEWLNLRAFGLEFPIEGLDELEELLLKLSADPRITGLELDSLYTAAGYHDPPGYAYDLAGFGAASQLLANAPDPVVVNIAVIDTQLSLAHQNPSMQMVINSAFGHLMGANASSRIFTTPLGLLPGAMPWTIPVSSRPSHGLAVASVIASRDGALSIAGKGISGGLQYNLHFYRVSETNQADTERLYSALDHIHSHRKYIDVVNISLGHLAYPDCKNPVPTYCPLMSVIEWVTGSNEDEEFDEENREYFSDMTTTLFVVAAGNADEVGPGQFAWPDPAEQRPGGWASEADNIISVGALDHYAWHDEEEKSEEDSGHGASIVDRACQSLFGDAITLATEGQSVYVVDTSDSAGYASHGGTSFAAPLVSSAAALLKAVAPSLTPKEIKSLLVDSAQEIAVDGKAERDCGDAPEATWRKLDTAAAIEKLLDAAISAKFHCCTVPTELGSGMPEFELQLENTGRRAWEFQLENTGRRAWEFHVAVTATSPNGVRRVAGPTEPFLVGALQRVPFDVSLLQSEPGVWTVRAAVSRGQIFDVGTHLVCTDGAKSADCLDRIELSVLVGGEQPPSISVSVIAQGPGATPAPTPTPSVSAGRFHTCAVEADGSVVCWGDDEEGQASPPGGEFLSISAGWAHTCGIRTDLSIVCWGLNDKNQASPPPGEFISVSAGREHTCGVMTNGSVECWGDNGPFNRTRSPDGAFISVSAADYHNCGVMQDGSVACWGWDQSQRTTSPLSGRFTSVTARGSHSCAIRTDGSVTCWGQNDKGQASAPPGTFTSISASVESDRTCGVRTDGSAVCWGAGLPHPAAHRNNYLPPSVQPDGEFSSISAGGQHICGLDIDGDVACWGRNARGQAVAPGVEFASVSPGWRHTCGLRTDGSLDCRGTNHLFYQTAIPSGSFTALSVGNNHNCGLKADRSLTCWGQNDAGQATAPAGTFASVSLGNSHSCGLREDGEIECWGRVDHTPPEGPFTAFATGVTGYGCGLRSDGSVECWGEDLSGQFGPPAETFTSIEVGWGHACGIKTDGTVACWGPDHNDRASPPDGVFVSIGLGFDHSCGLREDGEIDCWGSNRVGQTTAPDGSFTSIRSWMNINCAVRTDGSYVCWGQDG